MLQHATRWATLALALTLAAPAFAQSKDDASRPPAPSWRAPDAASKPDASSAQTLPLAPRTAPASSPQALEGGVFLEGDTERGTGGAPPLDEDFEGSGTALPAGWIQYEAGDGTPGGPAWEILVETATQPNPGNTFARSLYETLASGQVSEDFLVSPLTGVADGDFLIFDAAQQFTDGDYGSVFEIRVSTMRQSDASTFTTIASYAEEDFPSWAVEGFATVSVDLSAYAGQDVYVAFVHVQTDGDAFAIDNVRTAAPSAVSVESVSAAVQFDGNASPGETPIAILAGNVSVAGENGTLEVTELTFTTAGTDDTGDIDRALVAYTGASATGDPVFFGDPVENPDGTFTVTGSQEVGPGSNFFVLYYVAQEAPDETRLLDATFESATVDGVSVAADPTTLPGAVSLIAPPENDDVEDAIDLPGLSGTVTGTNVGATMQDGEPAASCTFGSPDNDLGNSVFYSFTAPGNAAGNLTVSLSGSDYDTVLTLHDPDGLAELACNDDSDGLQSAIFDYELGPGETVLIRISGYLGAEGVITLSYTFDVTTAGEEDAGVASGLSAFRPNPTAGHTAVTLGVDRAQAVTVEVVDLLGRRVATLHRGELAAGEVALTVPAGTLVPGTYIVRALGETVQSTQRLTVTR